MDLDAIIVFVKIVETGSLSGAARLLSMPKTTVSAKLAALEKRLQISLIQRTTRRLYVTELGRMYFQHCVNAVREIELGESALSLSQDKPTGLLKITAPIDVGHTILPYLIRAYLEKYPHMEIELLISNQIIDLVGEGVDLAIRAGTLQDSSLIAKRFFDLRTALWASPSYLDKIGPLSHPKDLTLASFIGLKRINTLQLINSHSTIEMPIMNRIVSNDLETIKALTILGEGISWLPDFLSVDAAQAGTLLPVLPSWKLNTEGAFYFVYPGHKYASPKVQKFIQMAMEMICITLPGALST